MPSLSERINQAASILISQRHERERAAEEARLARERDRAEQARIKAEREREEQRRAAYIQGVFSSLGVTNMLREINNGYWQGVGEIRNFQYTVKGKDRKVFAAGVALVSPAYVLQKGSTFRSYQTMIGVKLLGRIDQDSASLIGFYTSKEPSDYFGPNYQQVIDVDPSRDEYYKKLFEIGVQEGLETDSFRQQLEEKMAGDSAAMIAEGKLPHILLSRSLLRTRSYRIRRAIDFIKS